MGIQRDLHEFSAGLARFEGKRLGGARYFELDYSHLRSSEGPAFHREGGHSVDYGVDIEFDDWTVLGVFWSDSFVQYNLDYASHSVGAEIPTARGWPVSHLEPWRTLVGSELSGLRVWLSTFDRVKYPQDISLEFASGRTVILAAGEPRVDSGEFWWCSDNVAVCWTDEVAQAWRVGPHAPDAAR